VGFGINCVFGGAVFSLPGDLQICVAIVGLVLNTNSRKLRLQGEKDNATSEISRERNAASERCTVEIHNRLGHSYCGLGVQLRWGTIADGSNVSANRILR
jgi:hypothetical protein